MRKTQSPKPIFPVGLLLEGRRCLVVGGGRTAYHKARLLLDAAARVIIVSPDVVPEIMELSQDRDLTWIARTFQDQDLDDIALVYAATNDRAANQHILEVCRDNDIPCCSVDRNWPNSDFITPATFRHSGLVVTVSTGGRSCRHSRLVKDTLERHIQLVETADLLVMGTSHDLLPIDQRERYHISGKALGETGQLLNQIWGIHEFAVLNTCNRIEVLAAVAAEQTVAQLIRTILGFSDLPEDAYYIKRGEKAFEHTALLCSGLLSQTPGENNIVAQVKDAVSYAVDQEWAGGIMQEWLDSSLHISKHIRHETRDQLQGREIDQLCLSYLDEQFPELSRSRILVLGTGVVGRGLVRQLVGEGAVCTWCYHRNRPEVPEDWAPQVDLCQLDDVPGLLAEHDVVLCAAGGGAAVITSATLADVPAAHKLTIVDLAIPRNVSPDALGDHVALNYLDLDDLKQWYRRETLDLDAIFEKSRAITSDHADFYDKLIRSIQGGNP